MRGRLVSLLGAAVLVAGVTGSASNPAPTRALSLSCAESFVWCYTLDLFGDGTGSFRELWYQIDFGPQVADTTVQCFRAGGSNTGTCNEAINVGLTAPSRVTIRGYLTPDASSEACDPQCQAGPGNFAVEPWFTVKSYTFTDLGFELVSPSTIHVTKSGTGTGTVTSTPVGIDCGTRCSSDFALSSAVSLSAVPGPDSVFTGWGGPCGGSGACSFLTNGQSVTATFTSIATPRPSLTPKPTATPRPSTTTAAGSPKPIPSATLAPRSSPSGSLAAEVGQAEASGTPSAGGTLDGSANGPTANGPAASVPAEVAGTAAGQPGGWLIPFLLAVLAVAILAAAIVLRRRRGALDRGSD